MEEFAVAVFDAGLAVFRVVGEKELDRGATALDGHRRGDFDFKTFLGGAIGDRIDAGSEEPATASGRDFD
jgi:hypothetical protein